MGKRTKPAYKTRRKYKGLTALSVLFSVLAVVGVAAIVIGATQLILKATDKTKTYKAIENRIYPVVMFDPLAFEDPEQLDNTVLLQMSMWSTLLGENRDKYTYDDDFNLIVPASDLDVEARKLFGDRVTLEHQTFGDYEYSYRYVSSSKTYSVPVGAQALQYSPRIESMTEEDGTYYLKVGYIAPDTLWDVNTTGEETIKEADKYMIYVVEKQETGYVLVAVREPDYANNLEGEYISIAENEAADEK